MIRDINDLLIKSNFGLYEELEEMCFMYLDVKPRFVLRDLLRVKLILKAIVSTSDIEVKDIKINKVGRYEKSN
jgi:hypothetical protein